MKMKIIIIGLLATASVVISLLALSAPGTSYVTPDDDMGEPVLESLSG